MTYIIKPDMNSWKVKYSGFQSTTLSEHHKSLRQSPRQRLGMQYKGNLLQKPYAETDHICKSYGSSHLALKKLLLFQQQSLRIP